MSHILERLSGAMTSTDLRQKEQRCDVDYITALGIAGMKSKLQSAILRLDLTLEHNDVKEALAATKPIVRKMAQKHNWGLSDSKLRTICVEALSYYIAPACKKCEGRGTVGAARLTESKKTTCKTCKGACQIPKLNLAPKHGQVLGSSVLDTDGKAVVVPCPSCIGKGVTFTAPAMTPHNPKACSVCKGGGRRPIECKHADQVAKVAAMLEQLRNTAGGEVRRRMKESA